MAKYIGDKVEAHTSTIGLDDSDDDCEVGDAVALDGGDITPADTESHDGAVGVRARGEKSGDAAPVVTHGAVVASVATGLTGGTEVGAGNATDGTVGQFASGGSRGVLLCDEGGTYKGADIPDGAAVVDLR